MSDKLEDVPQGHFETFLETYKTNGVIEVSHGVAKIIATNDYLYYDNIRKRILYDRGETLEVLSLKDCVELAKSLLEDHHED